MNSSTCKAKPALSFRVARFSCNAALTLFLLLIILVFGKAFISELLLENGVELSYHPNFTPILLGSLVIDSDGLIVLYFALIAFLLMLSFIFWAVFKIKEDESDTGKLDLETIRSQRQIERNSATKIMGKIWCICKVCLAVIIFITSCVACFFALAFSYSYQVYPEYSDTGARVVSREFSFLERNVDFYYVRGPVGFLIDSKTSFTEKGISTDLKSGKVAWNKNQATLMFFSKLQSNQSLQEQSNSTDQKSNQTEQNPIRTVELPDLSSLVK